MAAFNPTYLVALLTVILNIIVVSQCFYFNTIGYEEYTINVVQSRSENSSKSKNLVNMVLQSNKGVNKFQLWTVSKIIKPLLADNTDTTREIHLNKFYTEKRSINIVITIDACFEDDLQRVFGSRIYHTSNIFIVLYRVNQMCQLPIVTPPMYVDIYVMVLTDDLKNILQVFSYCVSCSEPDKVLRLLLN